MPSVVWLRVGATDATVLVPTVGPDVVDVGDDVTAYLSTPVVAGFTHPGVLLSQPMIDYTKANIGNAPWAARWATLLSRTNDQDPTYNVGVAFSSLSWTAHPVPAPISSGTGGGRWAMYTDGMAAWIDTLAFVYTGDRVRGQKAVTIINSWMHTITSIPFNSGNVPAGTSDGKLLAGWTGELFTRSAEVLRYLWNPTTTGSEVDLDVAACIDKFTNIWYPAINAGWTGGGANWLTTMCAAVVQIGVFCDSDVMFQKGIDNWRNWTTAYAYRAGDVNDHPVLVNLPHSAKGTNFDSDSANRSTYTSQEWDSPWPAAPWPGNIWAETGRDNFHFAMGYGSVFNAAETAWHQGVDLYGEQQGRLVPTMEKMARIVVGSQQDGHYAAGNTPAEYAAVWSGAIQLSVNNSQRATFEGIYNHYAGRLGVSMPSTLDMLTRYSRPGSYLANLHLTGEAVTHRQNTAGRTFGNAMPVGDMPGWQQVTAVDFTTAVPVGGFVPDSAGVLQASGAAGYTAYGPGRAGGALLEMDPDGGHSTDGSGLVAPGQTVSVLTNVKGASGVLDIWCHTVTYGAETLPAAAVIHPVQKIGNPRLIGPYFRTQTRMRTTGFNGGGYHLTPAVLDKAGRGGYGGADWPSVDCNDGSLITGMYRRTDASTAVIPDDGGRNRVSDWHTYTVESLPGRVNFYLDDALMLTSTTMTPTQPLYWVLESEATTGTSTGTSGHIQFDWVCGYTQVPVGQVTATIGLSGAGSIGITPTVGAAPTDPMPTGISGTWTLAFQDEFAGSVIDTTKWNTNEGKSQNNVTNHTANVAVTGGEAVLTLVSSSSGAFISTGIVDGWGTDHYLLPVGGCAEARVYFPGSGATVYNWPAWWTVGNGWPGNGENDIAEGLGGGMTVNYHSTTINGGWTIPGAWTNAFHVYGIRRNVSSTDIFYDGVLVKNYPTADPGVGHGLLVNVGSGFGPPVYGAGSHVRVDYVRAWAPS